jgi:hypothetical protein
MMICLLLENDFQRTDSAFGSVTYVAIVVVTSCDVRTAAVARALRRAPRRPPLVVLRTPSSHPLAGGARRREPTLSPPGEAYM